MGVGKTALFHRILYDSIPEHPRSPTGQYEDGLERGVYCLKINGEEVKVRCDISVHLTLKWAPYIAHMWIPVAMYSICNTGIMGMWFCR